MSHKNIIGLNNHSQEYVIYMICSENTIKKYIGSCKKMNIVQRVNTHISSYEKNRSTCSSSDVLECGNYKFIILEDQLSKDECKQKEKEYINVFKSVCVNKYLRSD